MESVPITSQVVSAVAAYRGNREDAISEQKLFSQKCAGVSQMRSLFEWIQGDRAGAIGTQLIFLSHPNLLVQSMVLLGLLIGPFFLWQVILTLGFTPTGISRNSYAAGWMKEFHGKIPKDSFFAHLQSIAIHGLPNSWVVFSALLLSVVLGSAVAWISAPPTKNTDLEEQPLLGDGYEEAALRPASPMSVD